MCVCVLPNPNIADWLPVQAQLADELAAYIQPQATHHTTPHHNTPHHPHPDTTLQTQTHTHMCVVVAVTVAVAAVVVAGTVAVAAVVVAVVAVVATVAPRGVGQMGRPRRHHRRDHHSQHRTLVFASALIELCLEIIKHMQNV